MSSSTSAAPTIAFFGATGGCTSYALAQSLKAGYKCIALVRSPPKLLSLLETTHGLPATTLSPNLTIITGAAQDLSAVKDTIAPITGNNQQTRTPVSLIIFGIGAAPKLTANPLRPVTMDQPHVCEEGTRTILTALRELSLEGGAKPKMCVISTTGITDSKGGDVPTLFKPLYHWGLATPHKDKRIMEDLVVDASSASTSLLDTFTIVRPSLLTDGPVKGSSKVRVGWEFPNATMGTAGAARKDGSSSSSSSNANKAPGPAIGYIISRSEVGNWIFEEIVKTHQEALERTTQQQKQGGKKVQEWKENWDGKCVSLTY